jgi:hypothetical protein
MSEYLRQVLALDTRPRMLLLADAREREETYALAARLHWPRVTVSEVLIGGLEATWRVWCETAKQETVGQLYAALKEQAR